MIDEVGILGFSPSRELFASWSVWEKGRDQVIIRCRVTEYDVSDSDWCKFIEVW